MEIKNIIKFQNKNAFYSESVWGVLFSLFIL